MAACNGMALWSEEKVLSDRILKDYAYADETLDLLFLVDTRKRIVIPFVKAMHHSMVASQYLRIPERDLSTATAGHLVGGYLELTKVGRKYDAEAYVGHSSMATERKVVYTQATLITSMKVMDDFLYRSALIRKRSVLQSARAA